MQKAQCPGLTLDSTHQSFWGWDEASVVSSFTQGDGDVQSKVRDPGPFLPVGS